MEHHQSSLTVSCAQRSNAGVKAVNEDAIGIRVPEGALLTHKGILAVIADGVSAAEAGREASEACVKNLLYDYYCTSETWTVQKSVITVLNALNRWLFSQGSHFQDSEKGFITTLTVLIIKSRTAHIFHIGDSRIYLLRNNQLEQLTTDHSRKVGEVTYLARAMGLDNKIQVDYRSMDIAQGDHFILTTDGVHDFVTHDSFLSILNSSLSLEEKVLQLHKVALDNGSKDNLSCQIIAVDDVPEVTRQELYNHLSHLRFPPFLEAGQSIDGLVVERTLYESTRSQLYLVHDQETAIRYVMKTPSINFEDDPAYIERFAMESWLGKKFRHSKLVSVVTPRIAPTSLYYLMEYVEGVTLDEWLHKKPSPSLECVVRIARQVGLGLRILHRNQVIHQDLKPGNIIIDANEQIKLLDFGSCTSLSFVELDNSFRDGSALGTASYSAPECHLHKKTSYNADVFSLAVILFEMLTGTLPYDGKLEKTVRETDLAKLNYRSALEYNQYVPEWFDAALQKALSVNPEDRYQEIDEFIYDLEHPNRQLLNNKKQPLLVKNPVKVWQGIAIVEFVLIIGLLFFSRFL